LAHQREQQVRVEPLARRHVAHDRPVGARIEIGDGDRARQLPAALERGREAQRPLVRVELAVRFQQERRLDAARRDVTRDGVEFAGRGTIQRRSMQLAGARPVEVVDGERLAITGERLRRRRKWRRLPESPFGELGVIRVGSTREQRAVEVRGRARGGAARACARLPVEPGDLVGAPRPRDRRERVGGGCVVTGTVETPRDSPPRLADELGIAAGRDEPPVLGRRLRVVAGALRDATERIAGGVTFGMRRRLVQHAAKELARLVVAIAIP
jgi:hypothetical protein